MCSLYLALIIYICKFVCIDVSMYTHSHTPTPTPTDTDTTHTCINLILPPATHVMPLPCPYLWTWQICFPFCARVCIRVCRVNASKYSFQKYIHKHNHTHTHTYIHTYIYLGSTTCRLDLYMPVCVCISICEV